MTDGGEGDWQYDPGCPVPPRTTINTYSRAALASGRSYKLLRQLSLHGGTWRNLGPRSRSQAWSTTSTPPAPTRMRDPSPPAVTSWRPVTAAQARTLTASLAAATPRGPQSGDAFSKGYEGRGHALTRVRGARVGAARCPGELRIHHPPDTPNERKEPPKSPAKRAPPCRRSCGPSAGPGWACCRRPRPPRC